MLKDDMPKPFAHASHGSYKPPSRWRVVWEDTTYSWRTEVVAMGLRVASSTIGCSIAIVLTHLMGVI